MPRPPVHPAARLAPFDRGELLRVVVETTRGSRVKLKYDSAHGIFTVAHVLAAGLAFPFDFGFVPSTLGGDGDPLDALVLIDGPTCTGCVVPSRLIGVIEAEQDDENGEPRRNDRLVAVAAAAHAHREATTLADLGDALLDEIERFFVAYDAARGRRFTVLARGDASRARELVRAGAHRHRPARRR